MGYSQTVSIDSLTPCYAKIHPCSHEIYFACTKFCLKKQNFIEFFSEYQEPIIRSNTPSNPEQKIHAEGRGAKLFRKRQGQGSLLISSFNCGHLYDQIPLWFFWWYIICDPSKSAWLLTPRLAMVKLPVCQLVNWLTDNDVVMLQRQRFGYFGRIWLKIKI